MTAACVVGSPDPHAGEVPVAYVTLAPGVTAAEKDLLEWAADRVSERAAAQKSVTVLDALPVTDIGKPDKLPLRVDATRRVISEALAGFDGVDADAVIEDGAVVVTVTALSEVDDSAVKDLLGCYVVSCRVQG